MQRYAKHDFMKLLSWIGSFQEEEREKKKKKRNLFNIILCCQFDQQRPFSPRVIMVNSHFISE